MKMKAQRIFEGFAETCNSFDSGLPAGTSRCFNIGIWGGCELRCAAFCDGECPVPYEFSLSEVIDEFDDEELVEIFGHYPGFMSTDNNQQDHDESRQP